jgi:hypothetical protein
MPKSQHRIKRNMKKKKGNMTPPAFNNSIVTNINDSEVDELSKNFLNDYKNSQ